jgi:hypothetical protein
LRAMDDAYIKWAHEQAERERRQRSGDKTKT